MSGDLAHILTVTVERCPDCPPDGHCVDCQTNPELDYAITCPGAGTTCQLWLECMPCTAAARADDALAELLDREPAHGQAHEYVDGMWCTVAEGRCIAQWADDMPDAAAYFTSEPGEHRVSVIWENEALRIESAA